MTVCTLRTWTDKNTGREVRQLTDFEKGCGLGYFRMPRHLPDGTMLAYAKGQQGRSMMTVEPESGEVRELPEIARGYLRLRPSDGRMYFMPEGRRWWRQRDEGPRGPVEVCAITLPYGQVETIGELPEDVPGYPADISVDGRFVILLDLEQEKEGYPPPTSKDAAMFWHYVSRPRNGRIWAYDLQAKQLRKLVETQDVCPFHVDACPTDPMLLRYALDHWEGKNQRVWSIRLDGTDQRPIRPQQPGELVTHEFWWADGEHIGYTFQDRKNDPSAESLPWCEYGHAPTQLGIADKSGREVYLSDPVNHYHTHLYSSFNGQLVSGSGTDGHSFVYAARFDWNSAKVDFVPLATIHTPYVPFQGQQVNCDFSADGRWLLFSDQIDGTHQLCAVKVDL